MQRRNQFGPCNKPYHEGSAFEMGKFLAGQGSIASQGLQFNDPQQLESVVQLLSAYWSCLKTTRFRACLILTYLPYENAGCLSLFLFSGAVPRPSDAKVSSRSGCGGNATEARPNTCLLASAPSPKATPPSTQFTTPWIHESGLSLFTYSLYYTHSATHYRSCIACCLSLLCLFELHQGILVYQDGNFDGRSEV